MDGIGFQFKHCTIISDTFLELGSVTVISIQALYDYKQTHKYSAHMALKFQFKHCTIISDIPQIIMDMVTDISIQALYDYKENNPSECEVHPISFQFKHCTIISL